jgi:hypothetical protein
MGDLELEKKAADIIARSVDMTGFLAFARALQPCCYWNSPYEKPKPEGMHYIGEVWWSIYSFLATQGHIAGKPSSYNNAGEYLYDEVLKRLVAAEVFVETRNETEDARWVELGIPLRGWRWFLLSEDT